MKKIIIILTSTLFLTTFNSYAQESTSDKVKVVLMGTMHFTASSQDMY